jgi:hypothetical protein
MSDFAREHEDTRMLLPWYANGTLSGEELQRVRLHIGACLVCRQELTGLQRQVESIGLHDQPAAPPEQSFARLMQRIKSEDRQRTHTFDSGRVSGLVNSLRQRLSVRPPVWAVSLLLLATVTGGMFLYRDFPQPPAYRTLSDTPGQFEGTGRILRVVFDGSLSLDDFHNLLRECGVTINGGPNSAGAYTLQTLAKDKAPNALACMRSKPVVRFAEPVMMRGHDAN